MDMSRERLSIPSRNHEQDIYSQSKYTPLQSHSQELHAQSKYDDYIASLPQHNHDKL